MSCHIVIALRPTAYAAKTNGIKSGLQKANNLNCSHRSASVDLPISESKCMKAPSEMAINAVISRIVDVENWNRGRMPDIVPFAQKESRLSAARNASGDYRPPTRFKNRA